MRSQARVPPTTHLSRPTSDPRTSLRAKSPSTGGGRATSTGKDRPCPVRCRRSWLPTPILETAVLVSDQRRDASFFGPCRPPMRFGPRLRAPGSLPKPVTRFCGQSRAGSSFSCPPDPPRPPKPGPKDDEKKNRRFFDRAPDHPKMGAQCTTSQSTSRAVRVAENPSSIIKARPELEKFLPQKK